jgi:Family of unknown function (DUF6370)
MKIAPYLFLLTFIISCAVKKQSKTEAKIQIVQASCGECKFGMKGKSCDLAVRIDGKSYFVDGTHIDQHGDAHAHDGFCTTIRKAEVKGTIVKDRFKASYFKLLPKHPSDSIVFSDTLHSIAIDSFNHNMGNVTPATRRLVKYFKYIGKEPIEIQSIWAGEPHFICEYPKEPLMPEQIYSITICFWFHSSPSNFSKAMGFIMNNGERISFHFKGYNVGKK